MIFLFYNEVFVLADHRKTGVSKLYILVILITIGIIVLTCGTIFVAENARTEINNRKEGGKEVIMNEMETEKNCQSHDPDAVPFENPQLAAYQIQKRNSMI